MYISETNWFKDLYKSFQSILFITVLLTLFKSRLQSVIVSALLSLQFLFLTYYFNLYGNIDIGTISSLFGTNKNETLEFLSTLDSGSVFVSILVGVLYFFTLRFYQVSSKGFIKFKTTLCLLFILHLTSYSGRTLFEKNINGINESIVSKVIKYFEQDLNTRLLGLSARIVYINNKYKKDIVSDWKNVKVSKEIKKDVYLIMIGESLRRDAIGFYPPHIETTPTLEKTKSITLIQDPISPAVQTRESVIRTLALNNHNEVEYNYNIIDLANQAGFETYWISNQGYIGENDTTITAFAKRAKHTVFLNKKGWKESGKDNLVIPKLKNITKLKSIKPKVIFIHTMGSHNSFCSRIWKIVSIKNTTNKTINCYYNTAQNTYSLITESLSILKKNGLSYEFIYFSDHGLVRTRKKPYFIHGAGKRYNEDAVKVPFFFISSTKHSSRSINKRYFLRDFPHTFAQWIGVNADKVNYKKSILDPNFSNQENYIIKSNLKKAEIKHE